MDSTDFTALFRQVQPGLLRYVTRLSDPEIAQDVCAEAMTTLWRKDLPAPVGEIELRKVRSLAYRIAEGHLLNRRRGDRRRQALAVRLISSTTKDEAVERDFADSVLEEGPALERLSALRHTDREVIALIVDGFSLGEIAAILDCSTSAVKMRAMRARKNLKSLLSREVQHVERD